MIIICRLCDIETDDRLKECKSCGSRIDISSVINEMVYWDSLNEEARERFYDIIAKGLDAA